MSQKRILVTGATGRVAQAIFPWLNDRPNLDVLWQRRPGGSVGENWVRCDLLAEPWMLVAACRGMDAIVHLAGITPHMSAPDYTLQAPLALSVLQAAQKAGVPRMYVASSAAVYGETPTPALETTLPAPVSDYGKSKVLTENVLLSRASSGPTRVCAMRLGNVAGADALLVGQPRETVLDRFADGSTPLRSYLHPRTLARVIEELLHVPVAALPERMNVAAPAPVEMASLLHAANLSWTERPAPLGAIRSSVLCTDLLGSLVHLSKEDALPKTLVSGLWAVAA